MLRKMLAVAGLVTLILTLTIEVFAANPADLTSFNRLVPVEFYKVAYDAGPQWVCINTPLTESSSAIIFGWQDGDVGLGQIMFTKKFSSYLQANLTTKVTNEVNNELVLDLNYNEFGLGLLLPLSSFEVENFLIGPRVTVGPVSAYSTLSRASKPLYGLSISKFFDLDFAYGRGTCHFRTSKSFATQFGTFIPELRTKFTQEENFYGFGLGFIPK